MMWSGSTPSAHFSAQMARRVRLLAALEVSRRPGMGQVSRGSMMFCAFLGLGCLFGFIVALC